MKKKLIIIPALLVAIGGGAALAQTNIFAKAAPISGEEAREIAVKQMDGTIVDFEYDQVSLIPHYEIEIVNDNEKAEYHINAKTGDVTLKESKKFFVSTNSTKNEDTSNSATSKLVSTSISQEQAIEIAQSKAAGDVTEVELDIENGQPTYEIKIRNGRTEYEFEIDANSGAILKYEEDLDD